MNQINITSIENNDKNCNELNCNQCENQEIYPKIYWSNVKCSILKYNKSQTKCINLNL